MGKDNQARIIIHMDCDSFYASVEEAQDPSLHGKPIGIVGTMIIYPFLHKISIFHSIHKRFLRM